MLVNQSSSEMRLEVTSVIQAIRLSNLPANMVYVRALRALAQPTTESHLGEFIIFQIAEYFS